MSTEGKGNVRIDHRRCGPAGGDQHQGLVNYLQGLFGPLFLGLVGIVALFFLFTREITRFVQFMVLAILIAVVFYTPNIVQAAGHGDSQRTRGSLSDFSLRSAALWTCPRIRISGG